MKNFLLLLLLFQVLSSCSQTAYVGSIETQFLKSNDVLIYQKDYLEAIANDDIVNATALYKSLKQEPLEIQFDPNKVASFIESSSPAASSFFESYRIVQQLLGVTNELFLSSAKLNTNIENSKVAINTDDMIVKRITIENINNSWIDVITAKSSIESLLNRYKNDPAVINSEMLFNNIFLILSRMDKKCFKNKLEEADLINSIKATDYLKSIKDCSKLNNLMSASTQLTQNIQNLFTQKYLALNNVAGNNLYILD
ncbi:MAG: hypothetical protein K0U54_02680 [Bacteroidetes bacterium]|nr:hypothetical protein [Bacteroidota bacterium]